LRHREPTARKPRHPSEAIPATIGSHSTGSTIQRTSHSTISITRSTAAGRTGLRSFSVNHDAVVAAQELRDAAKPSSAK